MNEIGDVISQYFDLKLNDQQIEEFLGVCRIRFGYLKARAWFPSQLL